MTSGGSTGRGALDAPALPARALAREAVRARSLLDAGRWRPAPADAAAAGAVLTRLTAPLPRRRGASARMRATDRDRRLQRVLRTTLHHLDAGAVSPAAAALLAAVARAFLPWHGHPTPPAAAAAARYGVPGRPDGAAAVPPTDVGEALLPELAALFTDLAAPRPPGTARLTPPAVPWSVRYAGRFRRYGRPGYGVWTAETFRCPGCGAADGPWTVACGGRRIILGCPCGTVTSEHGLAFSEIWLLLPDT
ncbi:hypothetical protein [Streptomyces sp.]|uniref:hypothetical protein n=1 Tax=Streptomyces sp. TaxID=1931 RepID=UPI002D29585F|nr:hypothetical protein [Streptomyces sp.]HZF92560.1 hypothetical protein [Streptomyces sp.]